MRFPVLLCAVAAAWLAVEAAGDTPGTTPAEPVPATARGDRHPGFTTRGFVEVMYYHPTNEYDPNPGIPFEDRITARYSLTGDITVGHTDSPLFGRLYLFLPLGHAHPQTDYNYRADPILIEVQPSLGYRFNPHLDARLTYNHQFDLGHFQAEDQVTPWLALSLRYGTDQPLRLGPVAELSGYVEGSVFAPGYDYPASPGASPAHQPVVKFSRADMVNARYEVEFNGTLQPRVKYVDRLFFFASPKLFFGDSTLGDRRNWGATPLTAILEYGVGVHITRHFEARLTHSELANMGGAPRAVETLLWTGLSVRYVW